MKFKNILKKVIKYVATPLALVCGIIGLYSIDSYAYITNQYSYTLTYNHSSGNRIYFDLNESLTSVDLKNYYLCINTNISGNGWSSSNLTFYFTDSNSNLNRSFSSTSTFKLGSSSSCLYPLSSFGFSSASLSSFNISITYSYPTVYFSYNDIVNIDLISNDEITTSYYIDTYVSNYQQQLVELQQEYDTLEGQYETLEGNFDTLEGQYDDLQSDYDTLENEYQQKQNQLDLLSNGMLGYLQDMEFYINNQEVYFGVNNDFELDLEKLKLYNLYSNNSLYLEYFTTSAVNPNYYPLEIMSYYDKLPVNLFNMYFNGYSVGVIKIGYYSSNVYKLMQISFDNDISNGTSLINSDIFNGVVVDYIESVNIIYNNADTISYSINFNSQYNIAYSTGYNTGYDYGKLVGTNDLNEYGQQQYNEGYNNGFNIGKQEGILVGSDDNNSLYGMVIRT